MRIDCHNHLGVDLMFYLRSCFPYAQSAVALHDEGQLYGIDSWLVFPMVSNLALSIPAMREGTIDQRGALESIPYAFENERMLNEIYQQFPTVGKRMIPFVIVDPMRKPQQQVDQLRILAQQYPFFGLKIQSTIIQSDIRSLLSVGRCLLEYAEENNLPFLIHSSIHPSDRWAQAGDIVDIAEQTPGVRFCAAHSCRFDRPALDRIAALDNMWFDCSAHVIHCELATRDSATVAKPERRFASHYADPARVLADLASAYPDKLMWGSDSPFYSYVEGSSSLISTYKKEVDCFRDLTAQQLTAITATNTLNFLQLPTEKLQTLQGDNHEHTT